MVQLSVMTNLDVATGRPQDGPQSYPIDHADEFDERLRRALNNPQLPDNLTAFQQGWRSARDRAADEIDFSTLQARMKRAKTAVTGNLDTYLEEFRQAAERAGANVHIVRDAADANRVILEIARRHDVSLIAKSKSMVSEEIEFNHRAEDAGYRVVETDLGEWIVQLRHERPSHMVMPAVHLSRQEIGMDMSAALDRDVSGEDIAAQVGTARDEIRDAFFTAGMGITGANALIA